MPSFCLPDGMFCLHVCTCSTDNRNLIIAVSVSAAAAVAITVVVVIIVTVARRASSAATAAAIGRGISASQDAAVFAKRPASLRTRYVPANKHPNAYSVF